MTALGLTTLVGLITITLSTYMIIYSHPLFERLAPWLKWFERKRPHRELAVENDDDRHVEADILVFGMGRYGGRLLQRLRDEGVAALGVDFDPEAVRDWHGKGVPMRFGDAEDPDFLDSLPLKGVRWIVSTLQQVDANRALLHALRANGYTGQIAVAVRDEYQAQVPAAAGIDRVFNLFDDAAEQATRQVCDALMSDDANGNAKTRKDIA